MEAPNPSSVGSDAESAPAEPLASSSEDGAAAATRASRASPASPTSNGAREFIWIPSTSGEAVFVLGVRDGVAVLEEAFVLRGLARRLVERGALHAQLEDVAAWLREEGAPAGRAREDALAFLSGLGASGQVGDAGGGAVSRRRVASDAEEGPAAFAAADWPRLARAVLDAGHTLRFQARGRSMRPFLPHGTHLDVRPAALSELERGDVVLYSLPDQPLVAHRVLATEADRLVTRGDSSPREDRIGAAEVLGRVVAAVRPGQALPVPVSDGYRSGLGLACGWAYASASSVARWSLIDPLRGSFDGPSVVRSTARGALRLVAGLSLRLERGARAVRRPVDAARSALLSSEEKDEERRRLYQERTVQDFTSLDENVAAGLTLIEEVLLARHPIAPCRTLVLGCGPGRECFALAERGFDVIGLDREPGMLDEARRLARARGLDVAFEQGEAHAFALGEEAFDFVVVFSGLYNMILPRERRLSLLRHAWRHLRPGGCLALTFLSRYLPPGMPPPPRVKTVLEAVNPEHQDGDLFLLNESVHVFPRASDLAEEAREAGFDVVALERDQRAYDRFEGRVKGYALLRRPNG